MRQTLPLGEAGEWVARLSALELPARVRARARAQRLSVLGAIAAGRSEPAAWAAARLLEGSRSPRRIPGEVPFPFLPSPASPEDSAFAAAAASASQDYDDWLLVGHTGHSAVCTSLAIAASEGLSLEAALTAQVAANEVAGRLGLACVIGPQNGQQATFIHAAGAAAAAAKLLGGDGKIIAEAMAIALASPPMPPLAAFLGSPSKPLAPAWPVAQGIRSARLALRGAKGPLGALEAERGLLGRLAFIPLRGAFTGFGAAWVTDTLAVKIHPGCAYLAAVLDALGTCLAEFEKRHGYPLLSRNVRGVTVRAGALTCAMDASAAGEGGFAGGPLGAVDVNFSVAASVAVALLHGSLKPESLSQEALRKDERQIRELSRRVVLRHDPARTDALVAELVDGARLAPLLAGALRLGNLPAVAARVKDSFPAFAGRSALASSLALRFPRAALSRLRRGPGFELSRADLGVISWPFGARVELVTDGGERFEAEQASPRGGPADAEQLALARRKFLRAATPICGAEGAGAAAARLDQDQGPAAFPELAAGSRAAG